MFACSNSKNGDNIKAVITVLVIALVKIDNKTKTTVCRKRRNFVKNKNRSLLFALCIMLLYYLTVSDNM